MLGLPFDSELIAGMYRNVPLTLSVIVFMNIVTKAQRVQL